MPHTIRRLLIAVSAGFFLAGCTEEKAAQAPVPAENSAPAKPSIGAWGVDLAGMDRVAKPGDDFFRYVNGTWLDKAVIPSDRTSTGSFLDLAILSENRVQDLLAGLAARNDGLTPQETKIRDLYKSYTDVEHLDKLGLTPAERDLASIQQAASHEDIARLMGSVPMGTQSLFDAGIGVDDKNPSAYAVFVSQSGIGLPDRDYYLLTEAGTVKAREAYRAYIETMLTLGGVADAPSKAEKIFALETEIAKLHWASADRRDADKIYNPMTVSELARFAPGFSWTSFFSEMKIGAPPSGERQVIIGEKSAFPKLASLFARTPVETWRDYLAFHYLSAHAPYLPKRFDEANFNFYGRALRGQTEQLARAKRGVHFLGSMIGEGVGQLYVARYFPPEAKAKAEALVANILAVYRSRVETLDWLSAETKPKALEKVASFVVKIGYPDTWRDYSNFTINPNDLLGNFARGSVFEWERKLARLDAPVDRDEWYMSPQTVNAYYHASMNEIVFPAAILQAPFFDPNADDAVNYGAIGAVIGHEISHGFDDQGSKYDAKGVLQSWWTQKDRADFDRRTSALVDQFNVYSPLEGVNLNGRLTLGENIADLAGLTVTHAAYRLSLGNSPAPVLDGFTGEQRLFLGFAQVWRYKAHDETMRVQVLSGRHSPPMFRVNGTVRNVGAWYDAFAVQQGDKLFLPPEKRVGLW